MIGAGEVAKSMEGLGFERVHTIHGSTYKDSSTVIVIPTRGQIHWKVVQAWQGLIAPMNQKRAILFAVGHEVGIAYNEMVKFILSNPDLSKWRYIMTLEDDNLPPMDAQIRLLESIDETGWDAMSGIYWTKGDINQPQAYGDPDEFRKTGVLDFRPRDIRDMMARGTVVEVNGIAMGCALWRMDLFRQIEPPWFVTVADLIPDKGPRAYTQDLNFGERAKRSGKRFGVDLRVKVGHIDPATSIVY